MAVAKRIMEAVRNHTSQVVPIRFIHHVPDFAKLIRPVNMFEALSLNRKMLEENYRRDEPIIITEPVFKMDEIQICFNCYGIAGNHRMLAARNALTHLVYAHVVSKEQISELYEATKALHKIQKRSLTKTKVVELLFRAIRFLVIVCNTCGPSSSPYSPLHQAVALRTMVYNDPEIPKPMSEEKKVYGGYHFLQTRFRGAFGNGFQEAHSRNHFLYNFSLSSRHINRQLLGCMRLIETHLPQPIPFLGSNKSVLDILVLWENFSLMPPFKDTHIGYAGELTTKQLIELITASGEGLRLRNGLTGKNGALKFAPLCSPFIKAVKAGCLAKRIETFTIASKSRGRSKQGGNKSRKRKEGPDAVDEEKKLRRKHRSSVRNSDVRRFSETLVHESGANNAIIDVVEDEGKGGKNNESRTTAFEKTLEKKEAREKDLLQTIEKLKKEVDDLKSLRAKSVKLSGTRKLATRSLQFHVSQLESMSREELNKMKAEIDKRLSVLQ
ncbi:hypothetical protein FGB62_7g225 [Gracilaria domingensis]|nr:hypothetical protein FGB62_7g225 [Gracilaria domingensis]